jgi:hypothetical protein
MIQKILLGIIIGSPWLIVWYLSWYHQFPPISELADVKTIQSVKPAWNIKTITFCIWDCRDYDDNDDRWWSSFWWWK